VNGGGASDEFFDLTGSPGASGGLDECKCGFCGKDRGEKPLIQNNCSGGAESCEQRNHDERANRRVHIHIQQRTPRKAVVSS
jgi:hypothetical protein